ncbi:MAG: hypothetical protein JSR46_10225 [Verrucomicrobia bacterium]|nr:hypothetical protein [Verrucomicrobiota bacterium]
MHSIVLAIVLSLSALVGCMPTDYGEKPQKTALDMRQFQSKLLPTGDVQLVMKHLLSVLQDDHYVVKNVAPDLGFVMAIKEKDIENGRDRTWAHLASGNEARWPKCEVIEAMINARLVGQKVRVRVSMQLKVLDNKGTALKVGPVLDETLYNDFFERLEKELS